MLFPMLNVFIVKYPVTVEILMSQTPLLSVSLLSTSHDVYISDPKRVYCFLLWFLPRG